jgi:hypothetical protein
MQVFAVLVKSAIKMAIGSLHLNGKKIFHLGPLDQGWWPGSFLLPPSDEAIVWEMDYLKKAGFNMIRKHKKVEPRRYYYHADRMGFLIWQDQTSGGSGGSEWPKWKKLRALSKAIQLKIKTGGQKKVMHWMPIGPIGLMSCI